MCPITFDDGFASVVENAEPALVEPGATASHRLCVAGPGRSTTGRASRTAATPPGERGGTRGLRHRDRIPRRATHLHGATRPRRARRAPTRGRRLEGRPRGCARRACRSGSPIPEARWRAELVERTYAGACAVGEPRPEPGTRPLRAPRVGALLHGRPCCGACSAAAARLAAPGRAARLPGARRLSRSSSRPVGEARDDRPLAAPARHSGS